MGFLRLEICESVNGFDGFIVIEYVEGHLLAEIKKIRQITLYCVIDSWR